MDDDIAARSIGIAGSADVLVRRAQFSFPGTLRAVRAIHPVRRALLRRPAPMLRGGRRDGWGNFAVHLVPRSKEVAYPAIMQHRPVPLTGTDHPSALTFSRLWGVETWETNRPAAWAASRFGPSSRHCAAATFV